MAKAPGRPRQGTGPGGSAPRGAARLGYFKSVWEELKKVIWPTRDELWRMTGVVVATVVLFGLLIGGTDFGLSLVVKPLYPPTTSTASSIGATPGTVVVTPEPTANATPTPTATPSS
ncbi:MAG: preprotein translocase subunit SecE [Candidatus Dormibacteria bacterium]